jgi:hypothetical protein
VEADEEGYASPNSFPSLACAWMTGDIRFREGRGPGQTALRLSFSR